MCFYTRFWSLYDVLNHWSSFQIYLYYIFDQCYWKILFEINFKSISHFRFHRLTILSYKPLGASLGSAGLKKNVTKTFNKKTPKRSMHICVYRIKSLPFMVIIVPCGNICPIWYVSLPFNTVILFKALNVWLLNDRYYPVPWL